MLQSFVRFRIMYLFLCDSLIMLHWATGDYHWWFISGSYHVAKILPQIRFSFCYCVFLVATGSCGNYQNFGLTTNILEKFSTQKKNGSYRFDPPKKFTVLWSRNLEPALLSSTDVHLILFYNSIDDVLMLFNYFTVTIISFYSALVFYTFLALKMFSCYLTYLPHWR